MLATYQQLRDPVPVVVPFPTLKQQQFIYSRAKRKIIRAGRRSGKTVGVGILAINEFVKYKRVLYAAPTSEQIGRFWYTVTKALERPIDSGKLYKNESDHIIEIKGTETRIKAKTAWNADTLRGDYADLLILDEWQLMNEDAWELVGAPMLLDTDGNVVFVYTPPSLRTRSISKARDPQHAAKRFKRYAELKKTKPKRYGTFHFTSHDNPHLSKVALREITDDMTAIGHRMEVMAEDVTESPGSLWNRDVLDETRVHEVSKDGYDKIVVALDPAATSEGDEAGIVAAGMIGDHGYVIADRSMQGAPEKWAQKSVDLYHELEANEIIAESNNGGEMISTVINQIDPSVPVKLVHASRGKHTRAEPVSVMFTKGRGHLHGSYPYLEDELCLWVPGGPSPNRLDAMVWAFYGLGLIKEGGGTTDWVKFVG